MTVCSEVHDAECVQVVDPHTLPHTLQRSRHVAISASCKSKAAVQFCSLFFVDAVGASADPEGRLNHLQGFVLHALRNQEVSNVAQRACHIPVVFAIHVAVDLEDLLEQLERPVILSLLVKDWYSIFK